MEERTPSLEEQIAGRWEVVGVTDVGSGRLLTNDFRQRAGEWVFDFESVGCCAGRASYTLDITTPDGRRIQGQGIYHPNAGGGIIVESPFMGAGIGGTYAFQPGSSRRRMTITSRHQGGIDGMGNAEENYDLSGEPFESALTEIQFRELPD